MTMIEKAARAAVERACDRIAAAELPGDVAVTREPGRVVIEGRGLGRRMIDDARLRGLGLAGRR